MSSAYRYTDNETKRRSSALATDETPERPRRRPADYHRDLVFYIAPGHGFDFYGSFWKNAIIRDVTDPQKDFMFETTFPSRRQFDLIRRLVDFRREDILKETFRTWCEQFQEVKIKLWMTLMAANVAKTRTTGHGEIEASDLVRPVHTKPLVLKKNCLMRRRRRVGDAAILTRQALHATISYNASS